MKAKFITLLLLTVNISGCQTVLTAALGMKESQPQSDASVLAYASAKYPGYSIFRVDSTRMGTMLKEAYKPNWDVGFRPIQFICFAPSGKVIAQWASCEGDLKGALASFPPRSKYAGDSTKTFRYFAQGTKPLRSTSSALSLNNNQYTYLIYWTTWTNKQSINLVNSITEYVKRNGGKQSNILLVNIDEHPYYSVRNAMK